MSIDRCAKCDAFVDTDFDPDCYVERPTYTGVAHPINPAFKEKIEWDCICDTCRERIEMEASEYG